MAKSIGRFYYNQSCVKHKIKKPQGYEEWFYTGPSYHFGHPNDSKKTKR